jgi:hypothetical protein
MSNTQNTGFTKVARKPDARVARNARISKAHNAHAAALTAEHRKNQTLIMQACAFSAYEQWVKKYQHNPHYLVRQTNGVVLDATIAKDLMIQGKPAFKVLYENGSPVMKDRSPVMVPRVSRVEPFFEKLIPKKVQGKIVRDTQNQVVMRTITPNATQIARFLKQLICKTLGPDVQHPKIIFLNQHAPHEKDVEGKVYFVIDEKLESITEMNIRRSHKSVRPTKKRPVKKQAARKTDHVVRNVVASVDSAVTMSAPVETVISLTEEEKTVRAEEAAIRAEEAAKRALVKAETHAPVQPKRQNRRTWGTPKSPVDVEVAKAAERVHSLVTTKKSQPQKQGKAKFPKLAGSKPASPQKMTVWSKVDKKVTSVPEPEEIIVEEETVAALPTAVRFMARAIKTLTPFEEFMAREPSVQRWGEEDA